MIAMIDRALLYKERYNEFNRNQTNLSKKNPYEKFKNADRYLGWREMCVWFTGLFDILNSTTNRLDTASYSHNLRYLKDFHEWFSEWKIESINRRLTTLPNNPTTYQSMTGFFTGEASEDCLSMIEGIIGLTEFYCRRGIEINRPVYFLPRRISQDLVENGFSRIRLAIGHGRLDHRTTSSAITKVNTIKEIKCCDRSNKKRNASGESIREDIKGDADELCTEYASTRLLDARKARSLVFDEDQPFTWIKKNGVEILQLNYCSNTI